MSSTGNVPTSTNSNTTSSGARSPPKRSYTYVAEFRSAQYRKSVLEGEVSDCLEEEADKLGLAIRSDHVHMFNTADPDARSKQDNSTGHGYSSRHLRDEFDFAHPSLWTHSYFVSNAGGVPSEAVDVDIAAQAGE